MSMYNPSHPGDLVREYVNGKNLTVTEAAKRLGVAQRTLSRILDGQAGISPEIALSLERIGWNDAEIWMRLQSSYDLAQARLEEAAV